MGLTSPSTILSVSHGPGSTGAGCGQGNARGLALLGFKLEGSRRGPATSEMTWKYGRGKVLI